MRKIKKMRRGRNEGKGEAKRLKKRKKKGEKRITKEDKTVRTNIVERIGVK